MRRTTGAKSNQRLLAWHRSMELSVPVHKETAAFPSAERCLVSQMRRSSLSAPSNIAEGAADQTPGQFRLFLGCALRSLSVLDTEAEASRRVGVFDEIRAIQLGALVDEPARLTDGLGRSL